MPLLESMLFSFCKPQSKLDLPTRRHGSRERKNATEQIKNMTLASLSRRYAISSFPFTRLLYYVLCLILFCFVVDLYIYNTHIYIIHIYVQYIYVECYICEYQITPY